MDRTRETLDKNLASELRDKKAIGFFLKTSAGEKLINLIDAKLDQRLAILETGKKEELFQAQGGRQDLKAIKSFFTECMECADSP